ncbi:MAG: glycosyltransferase [Oscillospiraceae bacterium]|nr:glycosyltransferase [Oscillospiraceae bacterium]
MSAGLISVIVPIYNAEAFLEKCVRSILAQSYKNTEVILVNDGSTDKSGEICDAIAGSDSRVKVIHKENGGESSARNVGLNAANGEFFALVDHDDILDNSMYECMHEVMQTTGADLCICGYKQDFGNYKRIINVPVDSKLDMEEFVAAYVKDFEKYNLVFPMPWNKLYRTCLISEVEAGGKSIRFPEWLVVGGDLWFNADIISEVKNGIAFADFLPYNFMAANNPASGGKSDIVENSIKAFAHLAEVMRSILPDKVQEINKMVECQSCLYITNEKHKAIIQKRKTEVKVKWSAVTAILKSPVSFPEKMSATLLFFFPNFLYRAVFKLYTRSMLKK